MKVIDKFGNTKTNLVGSSTWGAITGTLSDQTDLNTALNNRQLTSEKDATGGYAGLTLFKINFKNALNTFTSYFTNANTASRTYTFPDRTGTIADDADLALKANIASPTFTGTVTTPAIIVSSETASRVAIIDGSKNVKSADTATYPSLTELAYIKGLTSAIQTQLNAKQNMLYRSITTTPSSTLTGTLTETQLLQITIAANTFTADEILDLSTKFFRAGNTSNMTLRFKMSTSNTMPAGTTGQIATYVLPTNNQHIKFTREFKIFGGNIIGVLNTANAVTDYGTGNNALSTQAFDPTVTNYFYVSATLGNTGDSIYLLENKLTN